MSHVNLVAFDLETYGLTTDSVILQIAAAFVDRNGETIAFSAPCSIASQTNRAINEGTVAWWEKRPGALYDAVVTVAKDPECPTLRDALIDLTAWFMRETKGAPVMVWGNGAAFDIGMLNHAYASEELSTPWHYRSERDQRTLEALAAMADLDLRWQADERQGDHHNALSDACYQAARIHRLWTELAKRLTNGG